MVSTVVTINQTEAADSIENALERRGMAVGGFQEGRYTIDEQAWRVHRGKGQRVRMYYKQFGICWGRWLVSETTSSW